MKKKILWKTGKHGSTVILFTRKKAGNIYIGYNEGRRLVSRSLGTKKIETAKDAAIKEAARLNSGEVADGPVTLLEIVQLYKTEAYPNQNDGVRERNAPRIEAWLRYLGPTFDVRRFDISHWNGFIRDRMSGAIDSHGRPTSKRKRVGERVAAAACEVFRHACRLATQTRTGPGTFLLMADPTRGLVVPKNKNVQRPRYTDEEYRKMLAVADQIHAALPSMLVLAYETGRRLRSLRLLWSDWLPDEGPYGSIRWRNDEDKSKRDWVTPVTPEVKRAIETMRLVNPGVGDVPIFRDNMPEKPIAKHNAHKLLLRCERLAGVKHLKRRGWHGFRRRWADSVKSLSSTDAAYLGGWSNAVTMQRVYQSADQKSMVKTLEERSRLLAAQIGAT